MDVYSTGVGGLLFAFLACVAVHWVYGVNRFSEDLYFMLQYRPSWLLKGTWVFVAPVTLLVWWLWSSKCYIFDGDNKTTSQLSLWHTVLRTEQRLAYVEQNNDIIITYLDFLPPTRRGSHVKIKSEQPFNHLNKLTSNCYFKWVILIHNFNSFAPRYNSLFRLRVYCLDSIWDFILFFVRWAVPGR